MSSSSGPSTFDSLFASGSYYESLQLYQSRLNRHLTRKQYPAALSLSFDGASRFLSVSQYASAGDLCVKFVDVLVKGSVEPSVDIGKQIVELFWKFQQWDATALLSDEASERKPALSESEQSKTQTQSQTSVVLSRETFIKNALKWAQSHIDTHRDVSTQSESSDAIASSTPPSSLCLAAFSLCLGRFYLTSPTPNFLLANKYYIKAAKASAALRVFDSALLSSAFHSFVSKWDGCSQFRFSDVAVGQTDVVVEHCLLVYSWSRHGTPSESDLFVLRAVLQHCCCKDLRGANGFLREYVGRVPAAMAESLGSSPAIHFGGFLLKTLERDAAPLFDLLGLKYEILFTRDPDMKKYLDTIGEIYFGRKIQKGLFDSLMG